MPPAGSPADLTQAGASPTTDGTMRRGSVAIAGLGLTPQGKVYDRTYVGFAVEAVVPKHTINTLIPALKDHGATDIIELPIAKIVH